MASRRRRKVRLNPRFFLVFGGLVVFIVIALVIIKKTSDTGSVSIGEINMNLPISGAVIRDEKLVTTDKYEKIFFNVVEGDKIADNTLIATVFKLGYQDESMIALLNLQKEVYAYQVKLLNGTDETLNDLNAQIKQTEEVIRDISRGTSDMDELTMEQQLKELLSQRTEYLRGAVVPDSELQSLYIQLDDQEASMKNWTRDIINTAGSGIISFYFDGYENVLNSSKLSTINVSLISNVVSGYNTTKTTESNTESQLYRLVSPNHWYLAFTTKIDDPFRVTEGETYFLTFDDYSESKYQATARAPIVFTYETDEDTSSGMGVVNILEFNTDIGSFYSIRTVNATLSKSANGCMVDSELISFINGVPCVYIKSGDSNVPVEIDILSANEKQCIIQDKNGTGLLSQGQKIIKP